MTTRNSTRGGLAALVFGLLIALFVGAQFFAATSVHAQAQAPAATEAPAAPAAAEAAPPACDPKLTMNCTPNSGDTAWMLTSVALVLMMTVPGLGLFYGGMVRKKNVGDTVMTSFAITCLITVLWTVCTYSMAFTAGTPFVGGLDRAFLQGILSDISKGIGNPNPLAPTIPETVYLCFQMTFHHAGADRRSLRRADEVLGDAVVHRAVGDPRLRADRPLGVGTGRIPQFHQQ
jgi:Amt family ammonium transporter